MIVAMARLFSALLLSTMLATGACATESRPLTAAQEDRVRAILTESLRDHPEMVATALQTLENQEARAAQTAMEQRLAAYKNALERDPADQLLGNPNGDVTIVEFFDYRCPYCKTMHQPLLAALEKDGNIRLVLKQLPILSLGSETAARAAIAAGSQGQFPAMHEKLMMDRGDYDIADIIRIGEELPLDMAKLHADMAKPETLEILNNTKRLAQTLGLKRTPIFIIGGQYYVGALDNATLTEAITKARAAQGPRAVQAAQQ